MPDISELTVDQRLSLGSAARHLAREFDGVPTVSSADIAVLVARLGSLPLALDQAAAFISYCGVSVTEYVQLLDEEGIASIAPQGSNRDRNVVAVFSNVMARLWKTDALGAVLAEIVSFLDADGVPRRMLTSDESCALLEASRGDILHALGRLHELGLVDMPPNFVAMHPVTQEVIRYEAKQAEAVRLGQAAELLVAAASRRSSNDENEPGVAAALLPHALAVRRHAGEGPLGDSLTSLVSELTS